MPEHTNLRSTSFQLVAIFCFLVIALGIAGYAVYEAQKEEIKRRKHEELSAIAELRVNEISKWPNERLADAAIIVENPSFIKEIRQWLQNQEESGFREDILHWLKSIVERFDYSNAQFIDLEGRVHLSVRQDEKEMDPELFASLSQAAQVKRPLLSPLFQSEHTKTIQLCLLAPLIVSLGQDSVVTGVILLQIDPHRFLYPLTQSWPTPSCTSETLLVCRDGDEVLYLNDLRHRKGTALTLRLPLNDNRLPAAKAVRGESGVIEGLDYRGVPVLASIRSVPDSPWFLVSKADIDEIYAPIRERAWQVSLFTVMLIAGMGIGLALIWNRQQRAVLQRSHDELESRVKERTEQLVKANEAMQAEIGERMQAQAILARANRALRVLDECNQALVDEAKENSLLNRICRIIVETGGYRLAWVCYGRRDETWKVYPVAQAGNEESSLEKASISRMEAERDRGAIDAVIRTGRATIDRNIPTGLDSVSWSMGAQGCGYASVASLPLSLDAKTLGALVIHAVEPDAFNNEELGLLTGLAENLSYGIGAIRARDERRRAEEALKMYMEKLERSNQDLQDFAFVASHDLQEPLRKVQSFGDMLLAEYGNDLCEEGRDYLHRMKSATLRMQSLIQDLLSYSRVTTKSRPFISVDLNQLAREVLIDLEARIEQTGGRIEIGDLPSLEADPAQMRQLFQNLVGNALKFHGKEKPVVRIYGLAASNGFYHACVQDNGIGFDEQYVDRIFAPFQRLHGRSTYEGTGMGLAICRKIAERHGGTITATSRPGEGSTFIVTLPVRQSKSC